VNSADTAELKKIPGIGSGIAGGIVRYRERLGGFYALSQLEEVKHVTPELLKWFKLENDSTRKLEINKASLDKLRAHPYLTFYQAKVIVEHRRKKGQIKSLSQLALYEEFTEKDLERLSAYVSFD
jgi:DNA uptake protein ComE-like DNA-binding protein